MALQKLTDKTTLTTMADADVFHVVDVSDISSSPQGTSKKSLISLLKSFLKTYFDTLYGSISAVTLNTAKVSYVAPVLLTGVALSLNNAVGNPYNSVSAHSGEVYTFNSAVVGGWAISQINTTNEPIVTDATKIKGATFVTATPMYLVVFSNGSIVQYYFLEI